MASFIHYLRSSSLNYSAEYDDTPDEHDNADPETYETENWDELEDTEAVNVAEHVIADDAASKQSSETLATPSSKRSRDDDDDDDNDSTADSTSLDVPGKFISSFT